MQTKEIPKNEWTEFFDSFSRKHEGWLVNLEIFGPEIGAQVEQRELALEGITDEWDETEGNAIMIMTGVKPDDHIYTFDYSSHTGESRTNRRRS